MSGMRVSVSLSACAAAVLLVVSTLAGMVPDASPAQEKKAASLSDDGSIGRILDREGNGQIRPAASDRWSVAEESFRLFPNDWVKTGARGANALSFQLKNGGTCLLGPDGLVEVLGEDRIALQSGEIEVVPAKDQAVTVVGADRSETTLRERAVFRGRGLKVERLSEDPKWLVGYSSNASTEAMGSLLATVDGRNVPLTMGYHRVSVDIRDQIARTRIEESFINHTHVVLEGVFYFPLPEDASISGFAMWIGDQKVEGEIVEKERAREIYETILREKRDPGLLEWSGGNLFKARVFPISYEKRIEITYTQVLRRRGHSYRYQYALQSDLTRLTPLKQLEMVVKLYSASPVKSVSCPTHSCRIATTANSASIEFSAEEYVPDRDFELIVENVEHRPPVVMIPHRRDQDGYLMVMFDSPSASLDPRDLVGGEGEIDLLVLADTSGSMLGAPTTTMLQLIEALLSALGPKDRFNLLTCDTQVRTAFGQPVAAGDESRAHALAFIEERHPLGWSNLDLAFAEAFARADGSTHIVYVGDGIVTQGETDPGEFVSRISRLHKGRGIVHTLVPGSTQEPLIVRGLSRLGSGSTRTISAGLDPAQAAHELLREISRPAVKDLKVTFSGIEVAAVHPAEIPNLPEGAQSIVVGRYNLKSVADPKVIVEGNLGGKKVRYEAGLAVDPREEGNSFIPRLWARHHLDHLLSQGRDQRIKDQIITLSEDYQIVTPYTSFLVLESDEDRERFQVKKRFRMRDGEEFFTEGRDLANFELSRKAMLAAKGWRQELRADLLQWLKEMGRGLAFEIEQHGVANVWWELEERSSGGGKRRQLQELGYVGHDGFREEQTAAAPASAERMAFDSVSDASRVADEFERDGKEYAEYAEEADPASEEDSLDEEPADSLGGPGTPVPGEAAADGRMYRQEMAMRKSTAMDRAGNLEDFDDLEFNGRAGLVYGGGGGRFIEPRPWDLLHLFPAIEAPVSRTARTDWPKEVHDLIAMVELRSAVRSGDGGYALEWKDQVRASRERIVGERITRALLSAEDWLIQSCNLPGNSCFYSWKAGDQRGVMNSTWWLGRTRARKEGDQDSWSLPLVLLSDVASLYAPYDARLAEAEEGLARIVFSYKTQPDHQIEWLIDRGSGTLRSITTRSSGKLTQTTELLDYTPVAGRRWPTHVLHKDGEGKWIGEQWLTVGTLAKPDFSTRLSMALEVREKAVLLGELLRLVPAKQAIKDGKATFEDWFEVLRHYSSLQRWDKTSPSAEQVLERCAGRIGRERIALELLRRQRRNEEMKVRMLELAKTLAAAPREGDYECASEIHSLAGELGVAERLDLVHVLKPVYERAKWLDAMRPHDDLYFQCLFGLSREEEALAELLRHTQVYAFDANVHLQFAQTAAQFGDVERGLQHLAAAEKTHGPWQKEEIRSFRLTALNLMVNTHQLEEAVEYFESWMRENLEQIQADGFNQYLTCLFLLDQLALAERLVEEWLALSETRDLKGADLQKCLAAIQQALGQGQNLYRNRIHEPWQPPLADVVRSWYEHDELANHAATILYHWQFRQTDEGRRIHQELYARVDKDLETMRLVLLERLLGWMGALGIPDTVKVRDFSPWMERLFARWQSGKDENATDHFERMILQYGNEEMRARYLRARIEKTGDPTVKRRLELVLFERLLQGKWSEEAQAELLAQLPRLRSTFDPKDDHAKGADLDFRIRAGQSLFDWMVDMRTQARVEETPEVNKLARRKLNALRAQILRESREAAVKVLESLEQAEEETIVRAWITLERVRLLALNQAGDSRLHATAMQIIDELWAIDAQRTATDLKDATQPLVPAREELLLRRCLVTMVALAALGQSDAAAIDGLLAFLDQEIAHEVSRNAFDSEALEVGPDETAPERPLRERIDARVWKYRLRVALDRPSELETALSQWFGGGERIAQLQFGKAYAYLLAELGRLSDACEVLKTVEKIDELSERDYRSLAQWQKVLGSQEGERESMARAFQTWNEWQLYQWLQEEVQKINAGVPGEMSSDVPVALLALFRKAEAPQNHMWMLQSLYGRDHDFRLLESAADAVIGQSAQKIYPFLQALGGVLASMCDEATLDRLLGRIEHLRGGERTSVDARALAMLELVTVTRALGQSSGTQSFLEHALRSLEKVRKEELMLAEARGMAELLASLGSVPPVLAERVLALLSDLYQSVHGDLWERLSLATLVARTELNHGRADAALRTLSAALDEVRAAKGGGVPRQGLETMSLYSSTLAGRSLHREAEELWLRELEQPHLQGYRRELEAHLLQTNLIAFGAKGSVSLGSGKSLYAPLLELVREKLLERTDESHAQRILQTLCGVFDTARKPWKINVGRDLSDFAFRELPKILALYQHRNSASLVNMIAQKLAEVWDSTVVVRFLVERAENEPQWLSFQNQDFWSAHSWMLAEHRMRAKLEPADEERVLAIVLEELRKDLSSRQARSRAMYDRQYSNFWGAKQKDFLEVAIGILVERADSEPTARYVAQYLVDGLAEPAVAVDALMKFYRRGRLSADGRVELCVILHRISRFRESIPILVGLVEERPDDLEQRRMLMRAYFHVEDPDLLGRTREEAEKHLRDKDQWQEWAIAQLAEVCLETRLLSHAAAYYEEAVAVHVKTKESRGVGDGTLGVYYRQLAQIYSLSGDTKKAVDNAAGAIVAWGDNIGERDKDLQRLVSVLRAAKDLDAYVEHLDSEVSASGVENPLLRKALGQAYLGRNEPLKAASALTVAADVAPEDLETHQLLVTAYDTAGRKDLAAAALLAGAEAASRDITLFAQLGERWTKTEREDDAERAFTNIVERLPNESESHQRLAEIREAQKRWPGAEHHFREVTRIRSMEPPGYLSLARILILEQKLDEAREVIHKLRTTRWPDHFGDIESQLQSLERNLR